MAKGFNATAARQTLKAQEKLCRLVNEPIDVKLISNLGQFHSSSERKVFAPRFTAGSTSDHLGVLYPQSSYVVSSISSISNDAGVYILKVAACGRKPITIEISQPQYNRDSRLFMYQIPHRRHWRSYRNRAYLRQKFIDPVHPSFRAQMFNLLMICPQAYLEITGGALLYKMKTLRFTNTETVCMVLPILRQKFLFIQNMVFEYDIHDSKYLDSAISIYSTILRGPTILKKLRIKLKILSRKMVKRATPGFTINGILFPSHHPKVVHHKLCSNPKLWGWSRKPFKVDNIKDFDIDISGDDVWPSYFRFGGDKNGWHLVRNLHTIQNIDMSELVQRLKERYPHYKKSGVKEQTAPRKGPVWVDVCEPIFVTKTALEFLQKKNEKTESERVERERSEERLEERPEEQA
ncbi:hypothetical protein BOTCAL_0007g00300 [Botryotinia calthae]|uniref:Uncharacterized protein n=1 Tax=Botryotinia calthae TaxID=38488 RepID=A0A4Y8DGW4_9HELO|nr:hypothetical protein BOTCAL_0007g00300 [Botryotinia calthae]